MMVFVESLSYFLSPEPLIAILAGVILGYFVGAMPGLSRPTALAVALPFTYVLSPLAAISLLLGVAKGSAAGGAITAILLNVPGEPSSAATTFDGYPMARNGQSKKALTIALLASVFGDVFATITLVLIAQPLSSLALRVGPVELFALILFAMTFIIALSGRSILKGLISALVGLFLATIGIDTGSGASRMTFGVLELQDGISLIAIGVGIMACTELMLQFSELLRQRKENAQPVQAFDDDSQLTVKEFGGLVPVMFKSSILGSIIGIIPGLGALMASFMCYTMAQKSSRTPELFGHGAPEGVAASETADNAATIASFVPLFALGIPGSVTAAILIGAFTIHGLVPGPLMFQQNAPLIYAIYIGLFLSSIALLFVGYFGRRFFVFLARTPIVIIISVSFVTCLAGVYVESNSLVQVVVALIIAGGGYIMRRAGLSIVPLIIGFVLGPMLELNLRQSIVLTRSDPMQLLNYPIALVILVCAIIGAFWFIRQRAPETTIDL